MDLDAYLKAIEDSSPNDWTSIPKPLYLSILSPSYQHVGGRNKVVELDAHAPHTLMVFKRNLSISLAKGISHSENFDEDWAKGFPDPNAKSSYLDFFFNSTLVHRGVLVSVDGARCLLPLPNRDLAVSQRWYAIARLVHAVTGGDCDFDDYARRAGLKAVAIHWPT